MTDQVNSVSSLEGLSGNSSVMDQWLAMQEDDQTSTSSSISAGSLSYQLEMHDAMNAVMSSTNEIQKQEKQNAQESGNQVPVSSF
ncbi:MAG: hypothetical protein H7A38_01770 [Chlamydiales bacterium]|nr:hypothetical protein [Chlamydiales bacterium]